MRALGLLVIAGACGGAAPPPSPASTRVALAQPARGSDDAVVATVDGRPVWASCVTAQARPGVDRAAALAECIDFELLARAAEARGLAADREVDDAFRTALVDREVELYFERRYAKPADFGARIDRIVDDNAKQLHRPEFRASTYARVVVPDKAPPDAWARARPLADQLAARIVGEHGLLGPHVHRLAEPVRAAITAAGFELDVSDVDRRSRGALVDSYGDALFGLAEVGDAVGPIQTKWGWDVIAFTDLAPARESTRAQLADEVFPELRRSFFTNWVGELERKLGVTVERAADADRRLDALAIGGGP